MVYEYAACRYIRRNTEFRDDLIWLAVKLGLSSGRASRPIHRRIETTATAMELEGGTAQIDLTVSQGTITVNSLKIFP